ncbi:MAG: prenyltransferase/squalene oxidase repeat-containing protein [Rivularia sp. (in: cyanobacteria)]
MLTKIPTLTNSLQNILAHISSEIATPTAISHLQKLANLSAPIPRAGFEIRLDKDNSQVDLQQGIYLQNKEPQILVEHINKLALSHQEFNQPVWNRIREFCKIWSDSSSDLNSAISDIWLEFDIHESNHDLLTPCIFLGINRDSFEPSITFSIIKNALELLYGQPINDSLCSNLYRCFTACTAPTRISHVGVMLSRQIEALRINVSKIPIYAISNYLQEIGYPNATEEIESLVDEILDSFDNVRLCFDVGKKIYPTLGLECFFDKQSGLDSRWLPFLDNLVAKGLCTNEKRNGLIAWVGNTTPSNTTKPWASHLIAESLLQPSESLTILDRRLSHIKLTYKPESTLQAKAYIGFVHEWLNNKSLVNNNQPQSLTSSQNENLSSTSGELNQSRLNQAIEAATRFLLNSSNQKGWWQDFEIKFHRRRSDEWVTAYVGTALASLNNEKAQKAANRAWNLLLSRQSSPGWGYNSFTPPDADSTAWTLRLATALDKIQSQRAKSASQFLLKHLSSSGGVACYLPSELDNTEEASSKSIEGWCSAHTCITAAVAGLEGINAPSIDFLRNTQLEDGSWKAYWWYDDEYVTALAAEALAKDNYRRNSQQVQLAIEWAASRINSSGAVYSHQYGDRSAFATAWCVRTLALAKEKQHFYSQLHQAVNWLIDTQKADGSWDASALVRFSKPSDILEPDISPGCIVPDDKRIFTSATVLAALSVVKAVSVKELDVLFF